MSTLWREARWLMASRLLGWTWALIRREASNDAAAATTALARAIAVGPPAQNS